jgi:hypothetical protein
MTVVEMSLQVMILHLLMMILRLIITLTMTHLHQLLIQVMDFRVQTVLEVFVRSFNHYLLKTKDHFYLVFIADLRAIEYS